MFRPEWHLFMFIKAEGVGWDLPGVIEQSLSAAKLPWRHKCSTQFIVVLQVMLLFVLCFYAISEKDKKTNGYDPKCCWNHWFSVTKNDCHKN